MDKHALAAFLRGKRERVRPEDAGLPHGPRRRTPGLRREEVAQLAHISVDHYSRLEQARGRHPSHAVLTGIARALRLSDQERTHLFRLAGEAAPEPVQGPSRDVDPGTLNLLERLTDAGALVLDNTCRVLAWNPLAAALFEDFSALTGPDRNVIRRYFLHSDPEHRGYGMTQPHRFVTAAVSYLRVATARYPDNVELRTLIDELLGGSEDFARLWNSHELRIEHHHQQEIQHSQVGPIDLDFDVLTVPGQDQQLIIFTAEPDSRAYRTLQLLKVIGTQRMDIPT
ncbi:helix-turn-helix transcriptional regulator [Streptomyces mirabilis]|uniref:helix-turn-helix transcriptional regulator n=1 Tax=Streptomyces mirabilis TaxID=68239 RepID=UPI0021C18B16|nr:helix-turn-helix transcriptional regulator [Streptomyces mirabilis]MCT9108763.1 helix-turn-helix transcriptional regulator [Streptomyces mirabilis]